MSMYRAVNVPPVQALPHCCYYDAQLGHGSNTQGTGRVTGAKVVVGACLVLAITLWLSFQSKENLNRVAMPVVRNIPGTPSVGGLTNRIGIKTIQAQPGVLGKPKSGFGAPRHTRADPLLKVDSRNVRTGVSMNTRGDDWEEVPDSAEGRGTDDEESFRQRGYPVGFVALVMAIGGLLATLWNKQAQFLRTLWDFSRPHTLIGSALCIPALHYFAAPSLLQTVTSTTLLWSSLAAALPALLINIYITGLNQITDVEIDKVNKPYLPIASGALSMTSAIVIVSVCLLLGLAMPAIYGTNPFWQPFATPALQATLVGSAILGTIYSLPPFRLKRFPILAAFCILVVRGLVINVGFYAHALSSCFGGLDGSLLTLPLRDMRCGLGALFFVLFGVIIALMKDIPDMKGDRIAGIKTFTVQNGPERMFKLTSRMLACLFGVVGVGLWVACAIMAQGTMLEAVCRGTVGTLMVAIGGWVLRDASKVDVDSPKEVYGFYMFLWKLFYLSYLILPLVR